MAVQLENPTVCGRNLRSSKLAETPICQSRNSFEGCSAIGTNATCFSSKYYPPVSSVTTSSIKEGYVKECTENCTHSNVTSEVTVNCCSSDYAIFFSARFMARALCSWAINHAEKTRSVTYSTDREYEANKRYIMQGEKKT